MNIRLLTFQAAIFVNNSSFGTVFLVSQSTGCTIYYFKNLLRLFIHGLLTFFSSQYFLLKRVVKVDCMMASSNGNISALLAPCAKKPPVKFPSQHKGQWRGALMFSLICTWTNCCVNSRDAGDLRRHRPDYDVTVMVRIKVDSSNMSRTKLI